MVVENPGGFLKKQMYVRVLIQARQESTGMLVPVSAILRDDENLPFVYVAQRDGSFARQQVTLGYRAGDQYDISDGLKAGDEIVVDGAIFVQFMQNQMKEQTPRRPPRTASIMNRIVASLAAAQRFLSSFSLALVLIGSGDSRALERSLPVDAYPDLSPPRVEIITQWPGHAAEEVERLITVPIERGMNGIPQTTKVRSISLYGLSDVVLTFEDGTDNYFARQEVFNRMADLSLPSGVTPSVSPLTSPSGLIYRYVLQSPDRSPMELKTFEDWTVEPQYRSVPGVADDSGFGGGTMQYQVLLDPAKIAGVGLSVLQVESALAANNDNAGGGFYSQGGQFYYVRGMGRVNTLEDIGNVVLAVHNGTPVLVKDVGRVEIGIAPRLGEFGYEKQDDAVEGVILMRKGEKTQDVLKRVEAKTKELNDEILPKDVKIHSVLRPQRFDRADDTGRGAKPAARHVAGRRGPDIFSLRFSCGIDCRRHHPAVAAVRVYLSRSPKASANLLSIGAVDFGILVDGAIFMVENIFRQIAARQGPRSTSWKSLRMRRPRWIARFSTRSR